MFINITQKGTPALTDIGIFHSLGQPETASTTILKTLILCWLAYTVRPVTPSMLSLSQKPFQTSFKIL